MAPDVGDRYLTKFDPFTVVRYVSETDWAIKYDDGVFIESPMNDGIGGRESFEIYCEEFAAKPIQGRR